MSYSSLIENFDATYTEHGTPIARDLKLNFKRIFEDSSLSNEEAALTTLAVARSLNFTRLEALMRQTLSGAGISESIVREAEEAAAIMGMLNMYYRFRHFIDKTADGEGFGPAKLRMQSLAKPEMGKDKFEMLSFAVSVINGCEMCITSHDKALTHLGVSRDKVHDLARLAATIKGLQALQF